MCVCVCMCVVEVREGVDESRQKGAGPWSCLSPCRGLLGFSRWSWLSPKTSSSSERGLAISYYVGLICPPKPAILGNASKCATGLACTLMQIQQTHDSATAWNFGTLARFLRAWGSG